MPDPNNPQTLNRYAYVLNNPLRYTDPTGNNPHFPGFDFDSIFPNFNIGNQLGFDIPNFHAQTFNFQQTAFTTHRPFGSFSGLHNSSLGLSNIPFVSSPVLPTFAHNDPTLNPLFRPLALREFLNNVVRNQSETFLTGAAVLSGIGGIARAGAQILRSGFQRAVSAIGRIFGREPLNSGVNGGIRIGDQLGKFGTVVNRPGIEKITSFSRKSLLDPERSIISRGFGPADILDTFRNPTLVFRQSSIGSERFLFLSQKGALAITPQGRVITGFTRQQFDNRILSILEKAGNP